MSRKTTHLTFPIFLDYTLKQILFEHVCTVHTSLYKNETFN